MTPLELRNSILQSAVEGRLASTGEADFFVDSLKRKKAELISKKTIRAEKRSIEVGCPPFEIPESWTWVRTGDCVSNKSGLSYNKDSLTIKENSMVRVLRGGNIVGMQYQFFDNDVFIGSSFVDNELLLLKNQIITPAVTSLEHIGKMARIDKNYSDVAAGGFVLILTPFIDDDIFAKYLLYAFSAPFYREACRKIANKSGQAFYNLSREKMMNLPIPIPPLGEQRRIVAKIEELMPLVDEYEKAWNRLEELNKRFPSDLGKSVLQFAFEGGLVPQIAAEGTGVALFSKIEAEKNGLIRMGRLKKTKTMSEISNTPFDIPDQWRWCHLSEVLDVRDGTHDSPKYHATGIPLVTSKNLNEGAIDFSTCKFISEDDAKKIDERSYVDDGDILFAMIGTIGNPSIVKKDRPFCIKNMALIKNFAPSLLDTEYVFFYLKLCQEVMKRMAQASVQSFVSLTVLRDFSFPLPPIQEQKRIVEKLKYLLPLCASLRH